MDRQTSTDLFANKRRVTRGQVKKVKNTFPFLLLPAELRNLVYTFAGNVSTLNDYFEAAYAKLPCNDDSSALMRRPPPVVRKTTPTVFLINKQIFQEVSYLLQKQGVSFHYGLLKHELREVISVNILRQVGTLEITDSGHFICLKDSKLPTRWRGYMELLKEIGELYSSPAKHNLKKLTVDFKCVKLVEHMTMCHESSYKCGFRDQMSNALEILGRARGIGEVVLHGLNVNEAAQLKKRMEKPYLGFLNLPQELRDMVYDYSLDWSDASTMLRRALAKWTDKTKKFPFPERTTPTILLLNKQISAEAIAVLHKKPLNLTLPFDESFREQTRIPSIMGFISRNTLKHVTTISLDLQGWMWVFNIDERFTAILAASENLKHIKFYWKDVMKSSFQVASRSLYPDRVVASRLKLLANIRGLESVNFEGDLPLPYTTPLTSIMTSRPSVSLESLPKLMAVRPSGEVVEVDDRDVPVDEQ